MKRFRTGFSNMRHTPPEKWKCNEKFSNIAKHKCGKWAYFPSVLPIENDLFLKCLPRSYMQSFCSRGNCRDFIRGHSGTRRNPSQRSVHAVHGCGSCGSCSFHPQHGPCKQVLTPCLTERASSEKYDLNLRIYCGFPSQIQCGDHIFDSL
jgi:hypothetical protein